MLQFCADVPPGNARAKECLEDNREKPGFTPQCKEEVEKMMADRADRLPPGPEAAPAVRRRHPGGFPLHACHHPLKAP